MVFKNKVSILHLDNLVGKGNKKNKGKMKNFLHTAVYRIRK